MEIVEISDMFWTHIICYVYIPTYIISIITNNTPS